MKTLSISLEDQLYEKLKQNTPPKKISKFIATIIKQELDKQENELANFYIQAEQNNERNIELNEWDNIDV
jgi:predicted DNA-binding protein